MANFINLRGNNFDESEPVSIKHIYDLQNKHGWVTDPVREFVGKAKLDQGLSQYLQESSGVLTEEIDRIIVEELDQALPDEYKKRLLELYRFAAGMNDFAKKAETSIRRRIFLKLIEYEIGDLSG